MRAFGAAAIAVIAAALAAGGCSLGKGAGGSGVTVAVTRDFGSRQVAERSYGNLPAETVERLLRRSLAARVIQSGVVESIAGASAVPPRSSWFDYVNGVAAPAGPAATQVHAGDQIWWDLHPTGFKTSAVVGSFPEPFVHGIGGKRFPTTLECGADVNDACRQVSSVLVGIGVPLAVQAPGTGAGSDSLSVVVGTWSDVRSEVVASLVEHGPQASGVYARFSASGRELELLDPRGEAVRTLTRGAGLVAAVSQGSSPPAWLITGTDPAGVKAASGALSAGRLRHRFALAVSAGKDLPLPITTR